jgi:hypothetical protein
VAGYSGTPLPKKLGIAAGTNVVVLGNAPAEVVQALDVPVRTRLVKDVDVVLLFTTQRAVLERRMPAVRSAIAPNGAWWVCWPKKASKVPTDITEDVVRDVVLPTGLVDVKVCAVDETWSGLKIVIRKELR